MRRGLFFAVDAFLAAMVIVLGLVVASTFFINKPSSIPLASLSSDLSGILSSVSVGGMRNEYLDVLRLSGVLSAEEEKYSLAEFVARLFSEGRKEEVALLMQNLTGSFIPENLNIQIIVDGEFAYATSNVSPREVVSARSMVTGIDVKKPVSGFVSRAYVSGNASKKEVFYDSLGGSLGYGNVTKVLRGLPVGVSVQRLRVALNAVNVTPTVATQVPGEIIIEKDLGTVRACRASVRIPPKVRVVDSYLVNVPGVLVNSNVNVSLVNYYDWKVGGAGVNLTGSPQKMYVPFRGSGVFDVVHAKRPK